MPPPTTAMLRVVGLEASVMVRQVGGVVAMFVLRVLKVESIAVLLCVAIEALIVKDKIECFSVTCSYYCLEGCCSGVKNRQARGYSYIHRQLAAGPSRLPPTLG